VLSEVRKERFAFEMVVELLNLLGLRESAHFELNDVEAALIQTVNNLACLSVTVRLNKRERPFRKSLEFIPSENIGVISQL
jgi:hypothetical protein